ncbi:hypothetical protein [Gloeocapsa sp. PCC 73106]|uniref:hypothetical protein n=1 Tax=Gloeocapsa sp. PCC 73106 TaxID=102232 RepID=UPI0002ACB0CC|nr:hypothetical protein [Gloeocapsa sp. PCC 73106]ELR98516.1 hypothetical protein GLO73106DRAFT_00023490 [Gloeocapsa sp. PCC 73106]
MTENDTPNPSEHSANTSNEVTHIGILVVHGIGEQCQFEALEGVARSLVLALEDEYSRLQSEIYVDINKRDLGPFGAKQQTWDGNGRAPIIIKIKYSIVNREIWLHLQEVWWADLDPPNDFKKFLDFWRWGLSLWNTRGYIKGPILSNYGDTLFRLKSPLQKNSSGENKITFFARVEYFGIALLLLILQPILYFVNYILQFIWGNINLNIFSQYMGKVKLYQQEGKKGKGYLQDLNEPPRYSIRRRMIKGLVQMATGNYDRWYILAHSLGSIVAFNGLSQPEQRLANYLDEAIWQLAVEKNLTKIENNNINHRGVKPSRPPWLNKDNLICRQKLFKNLRGLVTYGAPFRHFVDLWPMIPLSHTHTNAFPDKFQWLNVYDPSDPVATQAESLFPDNNQLEQPEIRPIDIPYKANKLHLFSHIEYLSYRSDDDTLIKRLLNWIINENNNQENGWIKYYDNTDDRPFNLSSKRWLDKDQTILWKNNQYFRLRLLRYFTWWFLTIIFGYLVFIVLHLFLKSLEYNLPLIGTILFFSCIPVLAGLCKRLFGQDSSEVRIKEYLEDQANKKFILDEIVDLFDYPEKLVKKSLNKLLAAREIRQDTEEKYFFPRYEVRTKDDEVRNQLQQLTSDGISEIVGKLRFAPDEQSETCIFYRVEGEEGWLWEINNSLIVYTIKKGDDPAEDPLVVIAQIS